MLVAWASKEVLLAAAPPGTIPRGQEVAIDTSAAIFTFVLSAFIGIGAGLFPAFWSSRHSMRTWLSDGSRAPGARTKGARALVVVQVGLAGEGEQHALGQELARHAPHPTVGRQCGVTRYVLGAPLAAVGRSLVVIQLADCRSRCGLPIVTRKRRLYFEVTGS